MLSNLFKETFYVKDKIEVCTVLVKKNCIYTLVRKTSHKTKIKGSIIISNHQSP